MIVRQILLHREPEQSADAGHFGHFARDGHDVAQLEHHIVIAQAVVGAPAQSTENDVAVVGFCKSAQAHAHHGRLPHLHCPIDDGLTTGEFIAQRQVSAL